MFWKWALETSVIEYNDFISYTANDNLKSTTGNKKVITELHVEVTLRPQNSIVTSFSLMKEKGMDLLPNLVQTF